MGWAYRVITEVGETIQLCCADYMLVCDPVCTGWVLFGILCETKLGCEFGWGSVEVIVKLTCREIFGRDSGLLHVCRTGR